MKQLFILLFLFTAALAAHAQTKAKPKAAAPAKKPIAAQPQVSNETPLKTFADSASYAIGLNIAQSLKRDLKSLNINAFISAVKAVFEEKGTKFTAEQAHSILMEFSKKEEEREAAAITEQGRAFLEKNKSNPHIKTTASGLQYEVLTEGNGQKPTAADTVVCNYIGMLTDSTEFDNSYARGEPLTIPVDGGVIAGWTEGLQLMSAGSKYRFYIPYELGYGLRGAPPTIPGGSALIFDIELLDVKRAAQ